MAFPATALITDFPGGDEAPISESGRWLGPMVTGESQMQLVGHQMGSTGDWCGSYINQLYGPDIELWFTVAVKPPDGEYIRVMAKAVAITSNMDNGINMIVTASAGTDLIQLSSGGVQMGADISQEVSNGDALGIRIVGSEVTLWRKPSGGSWGASPLATRTDPNYSGQQGYLALGGGNINSTMRLDDVGGGPLGSQPCQMTKSVFPHPILRVPLQQGRLR